MSCPLNLLGQAAFIEAGIGSAKKHGKKRYDASSDASRYAPAAA